MIEYLSKILLEDKYTHAIILPCFKIKKLIEHIEKEKAIKSILITREEEGIGIAAGLVLSGKKPFMLIQSSGLGNSINAICSLLFAYNIPLLILASYRGYYNETMEAQIELGKRLPGILDGIKIDYKIIDKGDKQVLSSIIRKEDSIRIGLLSPRCFE
jgi:sulfopyruvate decarboxylase alpha subunit